MNTGSNTNETGHAATRYGRYATTDVYQAAFFVYRGRPVQKIEWSSKRCKFVFAWDETFGKDLRDFHENTPVPIRELISAIYSTRRMLARAKREHEINSRNSTA